MAEAHRQAFAVAVVDLIKASQTDDEVLGREAAAEMATQLFALLDRAVDALERIAAGPGEIRYGDLSGG